MFRKIISGILLSTVVALSAQAETNNLDIERTIPLKDGSTVVVFKNGKMGMQDKLGRAVQMKPGVIMEAQDGQRLIMIGNEVMRVDSLKPKGG